MATFKFDMLIDGPQNSSTFSVVGIGEDERAAALDAVSKLSKITFQATSFPENPYMGKNAWVTAAKREVISIEAREGIMGGRGGWEIALDCAFQNREGVYSGRAVIWATCTNAPLDRIPVTLKGDLRARLEAESARTGADRSEIIRRSLDTYLPPSA